jgi:hypothetical protein
LDSTIGSKASAINWAKTAKLSMGQQKDMSEKISGDFGTK